MLHRESNQLQRQGQQNFLHWLPQTTSRDIQQAAAVVTTGTEHEDDQSTVTTTNTTNIRAASSSIAFTTNYGRLTNKFETNVKRIAERKAASLRNTNPRRIKTHIAKISYNSCVNTQSPEDSCSNSTVTIPVAGQHIEELQQEFQKKKHERQQDLREIQQMLNEISISPRSAEKATVTTKKTAIHVMETKTDTMESGKSNTYRRSKTDLEQIDLKKTKTTRTSRRELSNKSQVMQRSKSSHLPVPVEKAKPSLDDIESKGRRFMEDQKRKRKSTSVSAVDQNKLQKDEIRKRLEELRKNTKKLVTKNLQKKRMLAEKATDPVNKEMKGLKRTPEMEIEVLYTGRGFHTERAVKSQPLIPQTSRSALSAGTLVKKALPQRRETKPLGENQKHIGLLRKPIDSGKDHSFSAIRDFSFDKENVALEMLTPKISGPLELKLANIQDKGPLNEEPKQEQNYTNFNDNHSSSNIERVVAAKDKPSVEAALNEKKEEAGDQYDNRNGKGKRAKSHDMPYWLRPSSAQIYPYNFIWAVRRKLEAITQSTNNVQLINEFSDDHIMKREHRTTSTTDLRRMGNDEIKTCKQQSMLNSQKMYSPKSPGEEKDKTSKRRHHQSVESVLKKSSQTAESSTTESAESSAWLRRRKTERKEMQQLRENLVKSNTIQMKQERLQLLSTSMGDVKLSNSTQHPKQPKEKYSDKSDDNLYTNYSEISTNLSSISLQAPLTNTASEVSSMKTEPKRTFLKKAQANAEEEEEGDGIKIIEVTEHSDIDVKRRSVSPLSLERVEQLKIQRKEKDQKQHQQQDDSLNEHLEMDFSQLLEDFNRSLTQVIQVNEKLKSTLDKSEQILSPRQQQQQQSDTLEYSTDFELSTTSQNAKQGNYCHSTTDKEHFSQLKENKRQLFEMTPKVTPLKSSQSSASTKQHSEISSRMNKMNKEEEEEEKHKNNMSAAPELDLCVDLENLSNSSAKSTCTTQQATNEGNQSPDTLSEIDEIHEQRLAQIEELKINLKKSINDSKMMRLQSSNAYASSSESHKSKNSVQRFTPTVNKVAEGTSLKSSSLQMSKGRHKSKLKSVNTKDIQQQSHITTDKSRDTEDNSEDLIEIFKTRESLKWQQQQQTKEQQQQLKASNKQITTTIQQKSIFTSTQKSAKQHHSDKSNSSEDIKEITKNSPECNIHEDQMMAKSVHSEEVNDGEKTSSESISEDLACSCTAADGNRAWKSSTDSIKCYSTFINHKRGDFQDNNATPNRRIKERDLQQASKAAHFSSTEFAQSADDEITSSTNTRQRPNTETSSHKHTKVQHRNATATMTTTSMSAKKEIAKIFNMYQNQDETLTNNFPLNDSMSESSLNYSNIGLYDKLIQNETNKSEHLTALLKMREKALLDRTKGQIAWLEVQKARYKAKGLVNHIAAIKKKQRGIILKMEKEREEIQRLLQTTNSNSVVEREGTNSTSTSKTSQKQLVFNYNQSTCKKNELTTTASKLLTKSTNLLPKQQRPARSSSATRGEKSKQPTDRISTTVLKATYELETSETLENLLRKREDDLKRRREHVERLLHWHQRLDEEEAEVLQLERHLLNYNNNKDDHQHRLSAEEKLTDLSRQTVETSAEKRRSLRARKMERRLKEIDKSLRELSHISSATTVGVSATPPSSPATGMGRNSEESNTTASMGSTQEKEFIRTSGNKLNKLWRRLTSQQVEKYDSNRRYKLCKTDLERLYEEAKLAVLQDFAHDEERVATELLEKSISHLSTTNNSSMEQIPIQMSSDHHSGNTNIITIPQLNLNFSSTPASEVEDEYTTTATINLKSHSSAGGGCSGGGSQGNYSPSNAERNFIVKQRNESMSESNGNSSSNSSEEEKAIGGDGRPSQRLQNNVQLFLALTQRIAAANGQGGGGNGLTTTTAGLQRSLSDTQLADTACKAAITYDNSTTSQKQPDNNPSQPQQHSEHQTPSESSVRALDGNHRISDSVHLSTNHQRSKSANTANVQDIPSNNIKTNHTTESTEFDRREIHTSKHCLENEVGRVAAITSVVKTDEVRLTLSDSFIAPSAQCWPSTASKSEATLTERISSLSSATTLTTKATFSAQVGEGHSRIAKVSSKALSEHALSSAAQVITDETICATFSDMSLVDESNISTEEQSSLVYSMNFDNISTDHQSSRFSLLGKSLNDCHETDVKGSDDCCVIKSETESCHVGGHSRLPSLENHSLDKYETDFEASISDGSHIEDISVPEEFDTTQADETLVPVEENKSQESVTSTSLAEAVAAKNCVSPKKESPVREKLTNPTVSKTVSLDKELITCPATPTPPPPLSPPPTPMVTNTIPILSQLSINMPSNSSATQLMPDIINELELRRHQLILDNEHIRQYEHVAAAVPYMYVREIPNKPPPPYVPPAHGSPMTTIFPSEERIKDITFRRTHELYCELLKTDYCSENGEKLASVMEEQITNIYERITLDICREYLEDHKEILQEGDPSNFHSQLAFFNPPNRLRCIQNAIYKEVRSCLAMDKVQPKRAHIYSVYGQRAKQDHIGKIIIQEMYDEDDRWCNFHHEETEVLELIVEEMLNKEISNEAKQVLGEEGINIEEEEMEVLNIPLENENNDEIISDQLAVDNTALVLLETLSDEDGLPTNTLNCSNEFAIEDVPTSDITTPGNTTQLCT